LVHLGFLTAVELGLDDQSVEFDLTRLQEFPGPSSQFGIEYVGHTVSSRGACLPLTVRANDTVCTWRRQKLRIGRRVQQLPDPHSQFLRALLQSLEVLGSWPFVGLDDFEFDFLPFFEIRPADVFHVEENVLVRVLSLDETVTACVVEEINRTFRHCM
jgi:hypothetical protein